MLVEEAVVGFVVAVEVGAHDGEAIVIVLYLAVAIVVMVVADEHHSVVVDGLARVPVEGGDGIAHIGIYHLTATVDGVVLLIGIACTHRGDV